MGVLGRGAHGGETARDSGGSTGKLVCWKWGHSGRDEKGEAGERQKSQLGKDLNLCA